MRRRLQFALLGCAWCGAASAQWITAHDARPAPAADRPAVRAMRFDPVFGTAVTRVTDAVASGWTGAFPQYSKRQAWNADESYLLLFSDFGNTWLFDGQTCQFLRDLTNVVGRDVYWHQTSPNVILYNPGNELRRFTVGTDAGHDADASLCVFTDYAFADTGGEGQLSNDGRFYAYLGQDYNLFTFEVTPRAVVLMDLATTQEVSRLTLPVPVNAAGQVDWVSVSPLGGYVVVDYATDADAPYNGLEVYDRAFQLVWRKPLGAGHSDLGVDAAGTEFLVLDCYDADANTNRYKKFRLSDGQETELLAVAADFDQHFSCRNERERDWCLVSTFDYAGRLTSGPADWLPFEDEVFLLKLDGSGAVRRLAHHHSRRYSPSTPDSDTSVYWAEPHATISRRGDRALWGSNWGLQVGQTESVDAYVADFRLDLGGLQPARADGGRVLRWNSFSNRLYSVQCSTNFGAGYEAIATNLAATPPFNTYTDTAPGRAAALYRVSQP